MLKRKEQPEWQSPGSPGWQQPYARLDGSPCPLSEPTWAYCLACAQSQTERACAYRCGMNGHFIKGAPAIYGNIQSNSMRFYERYGVRGLTLRYQATWNKLLNAVEARSGVKLKAGVHQRSVGKYE